MPAKPVTIVQIARSLAVSPATISNAYHHPERLSAALRQKIFQTAQQLGFSGPNPSASSLRTGRIHVIGVLYYDRLSFAFSDPGYILFLEGVAQTLERAGVALTLLPGVRNTEQASLRISQSPADGYIIYSMSPRDPLVTQVQQTGAPLVFVDQSSDPTQGFVGIQDQTGARQAARHLTELGHRKIGIVSLEMGIGGSGGLVSSSRVRGCLMPMVAARLRGYREGFRQLVRTQDVPIYECKENVEAEGYRAFQQIIVAQPTTTAVLAMSDRLAIGVLEEAKKHRRQLPADLSVVGFDDIPAAAITNPPLTTIHQPHVEKGRIAAQILLDQIEGSAAKRSRILPAKLVLRRSTAPAHRLEKRARRRSLSQSSTMPSRSSNRSTG
jgi:DNA-binding LacI/PurR family transcriptional regulator